MTKERFWDAGAWGRTGLAWTALIFFYFVAQHFAPNADQFVVFMSGALLARLLPQ